MPTPARVVVLPQEPGPLRIEELVLPDPGPHQVLVKQFASGVCHSQLHQMHNPRKNPVLLGHESTGVVLAAGAEVRHVKEGDTVMVTWVPRDRDHADRQPERSVLDLPDGTAAFSQNVFTWADHTIADEQYVVSMPSSVPTDVTAILGCAVMTGAGAVYHTAGVRQGQSVAVFGVGGVGLSAINAAAVVEADPIIAVDLSDEKLEFAQKFGATIGVNASRGDAVEQIRDLTRRDDESDMAGRPVAGVEFAFDCIGVRQTMEQILPAVRSGVLGERSGGVAVLVGVPQTPVIAGRPRSPGQREAVHREHRRLVPARPRLPHVPALVRRRAAELGRVSDQALQTGADQRGDDSAGEGADRRALDHRVLGGKGRTASSYTLLTQR